MEAISAATAGAGVAITLSGQTEAFSITGSANTDTITGDAGADTVAGALNTLLDDVINDDTFIFASGNGINNDNAAVNLNYCRSALSRWHK